jgi:hypothetical protein
LLFIVIKKCSYIFVDIRERNRGGESERKSCNCRGCVSRAWLLVLTELRGGNCSFILSIARDGHEQQIVFSRGNSSLFPQESKL